jgi:hypothetical protein
MDALMGIIQWAAAGDWGAIIVLALAVLGTLDAFLLALLALSNKLWPNVTWDDNIITFVHQLLSKIGKKK